MYLNTEQAAQIKLDIFRSILGSQGMQPDAASAALTANNVFDQLYGGKPPSNTKKRAR